jgi:hypothetical protein
MSVNPRPPTAVERRTYTHYRCRSTTIYELAAILVDTYGWRRVRPAGRAKVLQLCRDADVILMTPGGCVTCKGPAAVVSLYIASLDLQEVQL